MDVQETRLQQLLEGAKQYRVPLYQRPYSWTTKQLERLWTDVVDLAEQRVDTPGATHFTGSLVLSLGEIGPAGTEFLVVDGQQRLTTLSLFVCALRDHYAETEPENPEKVQRLEETFLFDRFKRGDARLKVLPTQADRPAFRSIVDKNVDRTASSGILDAYRFFRAKLHHADDPDDEYDIGRIESAVLSGLVFVSITAQADDNVYRIFESLNNTGLKLTQGDLLRNHIFMRLGTRGEEIYDSWWLPMQDILTPADLETLFWIDLIWSVPEAKQGDIYSSQVDRMKSLDQDEIVAEVGRYSGLAQLLALIRHPEKEADAGVRLALQRNLQWGLSATDALILHLLRLREAGAVSSAEVAESLRLLESFMVRRIIVGAGSAALSRILYRAPLEVGETDVVASLHRYFSTGRKFFATDQQIREAVLSKPFYYQGRPTQRKMILAWLEDATPIGWLTRSVPAKEHTDPATATIEHVMPQTLSPTWREALADDVAPFGSIDELHEAYLHSLANLTLTSYNSELSNHPFSDKRELLKSSSFRLNREIADQPTWTRRRIVERGAVLADRIIETWAAPLADADSRDVGVSWTLVLDIVAAIPAGRWASYGDVATVAGTHPVPLGHFLAQAPAPNAYRVLQRAGRISPGFAWNDDSAHSQFTPVDVLSAEGVGFDAAGRADISRKLTVPELAASVGLSIRSDVDPVADEDERARFLGGVASRQAPSTVEGVADLLDEWERLGGILEFGTSEETSCFLVAQRSATTKSIWPLTVYPSGTVEVVFQHMLRRPPFDSVALRQDLFTRLNLVRGIELPDGRLEKRPPFDLEVLADREARAQLVEVLEWFMDTLAAHELTPGTDL
ncbi:DUF262 domain-containing protein [Rathayibacter sp. VKM Ac-2835]|uniref:GmrSD restriction endonuclease domain-containing protein n=1 Tax=Rathayibacter sp. VKM Ac-2835 TaxID=2739043 RepID=UPI0015666859|nr:DUF262 domain-containing protein [Rathayibacter sp. VKM Ac-2835]NRG40842.1 DUF262 domain-containing protein [Rathayibacter sp. VKM Ac-2835]